MMARAEIRLNEGFRAYTEHQLATDPRPFLKAAQILEDGGSIAKAYATLPPQARTTLFHVESRPPLSMLLDAGREDAISMLRGCAEDLAP